MSQSYYITVKKHNLFLKDGDHHGCGGGVADPHGEEGGRQHEPQHQKSTRDQPQNNIYITYNQLTRTFMENYNVFTTVSFFQAHTDKKENKISSYIRKFRVEHLQSHK